jgi:hypothetical protein
MDTSIRHVLSRAEGDATQAGPESPCLERLEQNLFNPAYGAGHATVAGACAIL